MQISVQYDNTRQNRLTVRQDSATIKVARDLTETAKAAVVAFLSGIAHEHKGTRSTLRGSTDKIELGITLSNDSRAIHHHYKGSFYA